MNGSVFKKLAIALLGCTLFWGVPACAQTDSTQTDSAQTATVQTEAAIDSSFRTSVNHNFTWAAFVLTHKALRNSESLHNWPFFPLATPIAWNSDFRAEKDLGKLLTLKGMVGSNLSIMDLGFNSDITLEAIHLLELGISANIHSSFNYGSYATFMGVYNAEEGAFDRDMFMTAFSYGIKYRVGATIPLIAFLPRSKWTRIVLRPNANWTFTKYTNAEEGEIWKCGSEYSANGYRYRYGGTLIYMLPFQRFPMLMVNAGVGGFLRSTKFDEVYDGYDPYFKTFSILPMLSIKVNEKWNGMIMANFSRDRKYRNYHYEVTEELLQERIGSEWGTKVIMATFSRKF